MVCLGHLEKTWETNGARIWKSAPTITHSMEVQLLRVLLSRRWSSC